MAKARLTELGLSKLAPPESGRIEIFDATLPGFGVRVTTNGTRSFFVMTRVRGALKRVTLASHPTLKLAQARTLAREAMAKARLGEDPSAAKRAARRPAERPVERVVADHIARAQRGRGRRSWREVERSLTRELAPWSGRPIENIARADVLELLDAIVDRGSPAMANLLLRHLKHLLGWCVERGLIEASPAAARVLTEPELAAAWAACEALGWPFGPLVRLLILTAQRRNEVAGMRWCDLPLEQRVWILPRELTKSNRAHVVPLSDSAIEIIAAPPRFGELVFPASRAGSANAVSGFSRAKCRLDAEALRLLRIYATKHGQEAARVELKPWRLHDLRRTAASGMARLRAAPHVIGHALNHAPGASLGQIGAIYVRYDYEREARQLLAAWACEVKRVTGEAQCGTQIRLLRGRDHPALLYEIHQISQRNDHEVLSRWIG
jgi:integrase